MVANSFPENFRFLFTKPNSFASSSKREGGLNDDTVLQKIVVIHLESKDS
jgi:hypothetical protein